jgi:hypothetical protein
MYMEMSQGSYGYPEDRLNRSKTILPMNINPYIWGSLVNEGSHSQYRKLYSDTAEVTFGMKVEKLSMTLVQTSAPQPSF